MRLRRWLYLLFLAVIIPVALLTTGEAQSQNQVTIRVPSWWFGEPANKDWMAAVIQAFEAGNPSIKVNGYNQPYPDYMDKIVAEISAGSPPDVVHLLNMNMGDLLRLGVLAPLDEFISHSDISAKTYTAAQFQPPLFYNGHTYGVIHMVANYIPFYNKDLLEKAGYSKFPDNPRDFVQMLKKISNPPNQFAYAAMVKPGNPVEMYMDVVEWVLANGGSFARNGKPTIDHPKNVEAIQLYKEIFDANVMPKGVDKSTYRKMWWEGRVAVLFDGSWMMSFAKDNNPSIIPKLATALMPWPGHTTAAAFQVWAIPKDSRHQTEAWKFIEFMQSAEWQRKMVQITSAVSPRKGAVSPEYLAANPWFASFREAAEKYSVSNMPAGLESHGNEIIKIISSHIEEVLYKNVPVKDALKAAQAEVVTLLK